MEEPKTDFLTKNVVKCALSIANLLQRFFCEMIELIDWSEMCEYEQLVRWDVTIS